MSAKNKLRNKPFIEFIAIIIFIIVFIGIMAFEIWYIKNIGIDTNINCYWTTNGIICGGKL